MLLQLAYVVMLKKLTRSKRVFCVFEVSGIFLPKLSS